MRQELSGAGGKPTDVPPLPPTPYYVVDRPTLERLYDRIRDGLAATWPNSIIGYSYKTNALPWILGFMRDRGAWAEVVSDTEYELARALGVNPDRIIFNGPIKGRDCLRSALADGSMVNLDSVREVRWTCELAQERPDLDVSVGVRVNWDLESWRPGDSAVPDECGRFGFSADSGGLDRAMGQLAAAGVRVSGLHLHISSASRGVPVYRALGEAAARLVAGRRLDLDYLDVGGGFFGSERPGTPPFSEYVGAIRAGLGGCVDPARTTLVVEPGASLIAVPVEFHTSVLDTKEISRWTVVTTDGSRENIDPLHRRRAPYCYRIVPDDTGARAREVVPRQIVGGFTCMEDDRLMRIDDVPALLEGDRIVYYEVGAYTMCLQPMFIEYLPAVYVREDDRLRSVRSPWGVKEYLMNSVVPEPASAPAELGVSVEQAAEEAR